MGPYQLIRRRSTRSVLYNSQYLVKVEQPVETQWPQNYDSPGTDRLHRVESS